MKEGWEVKKLGEVCEILDCFRRPVTKKDRRVGKYPYYGASGIQDYVDSYIFDGRYLLVGEDGAKWGASDKSAYIIEGKSWVNNHAHILKVNDYIIDKFIEYYLVYKDLSEYITGAIVPKLTQQALKSILIPIPPLPEQSRIVEELDLLSNIIEKKRQQLSELDNLAQSIFYDMFGDPVTNEKGWEVKTFGEEFDISSGGTPDTKNNMYWENGTISWIGSNLCQNTTLYNNDGKYITELGYEKSSAKRFYPGFVLVALVGATIGKVGLLRFETTTNQNVAGINVPKNDSFTSEFVFYLLQHLYCMFEAVGGDKFKMANLKFVRSLPLLLPPLSLQQLFAQKIEAIEKEKELIKQSIKETEELFNSRMDYYFG